MGSARGLILPGKGVDERLAYAEHRGDVIDGEQRWKLIK